ncbi:hypothetical protein B7R21_15275 [Subtercola boreus]|uniref:DUF2178 domain-containing protein n=1 Tax=Subtercola boreus TaxID=120213 RepID=A0A3E0VDV3_9MICO|nr:hypothetical protein [Subtercola boreus]RFA07550.1 hypothetical protein B7R21_15275 [Subtercola boreus]
MLRTVTPRTAGIVAIAIGVALAVCGGWMIAWPPVSILGAIVLAPATLLVAIGCVWLVRRVWDESWPPDVRPDLAKRLRIRRVLLVASGVLLPVALAYGIFSATRGEWGSLVIALILALNAATNLSVYRRLGQ